MLPRRHRLTRPSEFRAVLRGAPGLQRRRPVGTDLLVVHAATGQESGSAPPTRPQRVGFVVSRAVGNSVVRHRVVRRLRAQVADRLGQLPTGTDVVVRARPAAAGATSEQLGAALDHALGRVVGGTGGER